MRFGVLGPLAVWTADGEPVTVPELKVRALLAALLVDPGHVVSTDRLVEFGWGPEAPANPAAAVQTRVSRLRRALSAAGGEGLVEHRPPGYRLSAETGAVDASRFLSSVGRARATSDVAVRRDLLS
ncbi:MAG: AfsR/SARP family transcriptional regulator, partial [Stackebrandtia sp.]